VAAVIAVDTSLLRMTQLIERQASEQPISLAMSFNWFSFLTVLSLVSSPKYFSHHIFSIAVNPLILLARESSGTPFSYLFVAIPPHKGDQTVLPSLYSSNNLPYSFSNLSRTKMLYCGCSTTGRWRLSLSQTANASIIEKLLHSLVPQ